MYKNISKKKIRKYTKKKYNKNKFLKKKFSKNKLRKGGGSKSNKSKSNKSKSNKSKKPKINKRISKKSISKKPISKQSISKKSIPKQSFRNKKLGIVHISCHGQVDKDSTRHNTRHNNFLLLNKYNFSVRTIRAAILSICYMDTMTQQIKNRDLLNKFIYYKNYNIDELEILKDKLFKINESVTEENITTCSRGDKDIIYDNPRFDFYMNKIFKPNFDIGDLSLKGDVYKNHKNFSADIEDYENLKNVLDFDKEGEKIQFTITLLYLDENNEIQNYVLFGKDFEGFNDIRFNDIYEKIYNIQGTFNNNQKIPYFDDILTVDFSCSSLNDELKNKYLKLAFKKSGINNNGDLDEKFEKLNYNKKQEIYNNWIKIFENIHNTKKSTVYQDSPSVKYDTSNINTGILDDDTPSLSESESESESESMQESDTDKKQSFSKYNFVD